MNEEITKSEGLDEYSEKLKPSIILNDKLYCFAGQHNVTRILGFNEQGTVVTLVNSGWNKIWHDGYADPKKISTNPDIHVKMNDELYQRYMEKVDSFNKLKRDKEKKDKQESIIKIGKLIKTIRSINNNIQINEDIPKDSLASIKDLCCECFIDKDGYPDYGVLDKVRDACKGIGILLYPKEKDSCGWLIGCLNISGYEIIFG